MTQKIRAAVVGLGNIGRYALDALRAADDFEVAGVVRRSVNSQDAQKLDCAVVKDIAELGKVDVAVLCTPTRSVLEAAKGILAQGINTVDSFDIHGDIVGLKSALDPIAKKNNVTSIIAAGWDPGSDSVVRAMMLAMAPKGITYTNFGPGMSMGHSVAVKSIAGVKDALSVTVPLGTGIHRRMVYVELENGVSFDVIEKAVKTDPYFVHDETHVKQVPSVDALKDMGHGVYMVRKGVSGSTPNQIFEFNMKINNPALTAQVLVASARATMKQASGAYTMIEVPPIYYLNGETDELIRQLV